MSRQVWGTFSVKDHLEQNAFVAEVMLYDRLVIPVPPNKEEETRWKDPAREWDPQRQKVLLKILGDRAFRVDWNNERKERWKSRYDAGSELARTVPDWAFAATRTEMTAGLPRHVTGVQAVTAYRSADNLEQDLKLRKVDAVEPIPGGAVAAIIGYEFLVPNDPGLSHEELLEQAVALSSSTEYKRKKASYWRWQREFIDDEGMTDMSSINAAIEEMAGLLEDERQVVRSSKIKTSSKYAFFLGSLTLGMFGGPLTPVGVAGAFISVGKFFSERLLKAEQDDDTKPTALLLDTRKHFDWQ